MEKIVLIGGGHAKVLIDLIRTSAKYGIAEILDSQFEMSTTVLGNDDLLSGLYADGVKNACIAVESVKDNSKRMMLYNKVKQMGFQPLF